MHIKGWKCNQINNRYAPKEKISCVFNACHFLKVRKQVPWNSSPDVTPSKYSYMFNDYQLFRTFIEKINWQTYVFNKNIFRKKFSKLIIFWWKILCLMLRRRDFSFDYFNWFQEYPMKNCLIISPWRSSKAGIQTWKNVNITKWKVTCFEIKLKWLYLR